jgi:hypothetical protein
VLQRTCCHERPASRYFDESGNYFLHKEKDEHEGDNWLEDAEQYIAPKAAAAPRVEFVADASDPQKRSRADLLAGMIKYMQPRETVQQAMRRLGGKAPGGQRKWQKKKATEAAEADSSGGSAADDKAFGELTACTDELLADGEFDV